MNVDYDEKEARFTVKKGEKFDADELKQAIADSRKGKLGEIKAAPK